ncbi:linear amide C-N hydrolases [Nanobdella aerobiophila]|uniref:Linear amide C-N hydrolases n=1 Tax=Nanobdella aerobiophila TaxID=2586965 RepID=A0A915SFH1_9ARCH|nr:C45 family peptidase [Nanobdella aerobiophila]BBL45735.1 linear amide C-N hydrolases [Nanobdella aerobiophila]
MILRRLSGDYYEIGYEEGNIYKRYMDLHTLKIDPEIYKNQLLMYKKYYPEFLEELKGIIDASKIDKDKITYWLISNELVSYLNYVVKKIREKCTVFGVKNNKGIFVGKNYDWIPIAEDFIEYVKVYNKDAYPFIFVTDMGIDRYKYIKMRFHSPSDAINKYGLYIGIIAAYNDKYRYGINTTHAVKLVAEKCKNVEEAIELFKSIKICIPMNFFIADKNNFVVIEHTTERFKIIYPENNILVKTNHYIDRELQNEDMIIKMYPSSNSFRRYYTILTDLFKNRDTFQYSDIIKLLTDKRVMQRSKLKYGTKTIWSLALDNNIKRYTLITYKGNKISSIKLSI